MIKTGILIAVLPFIISCVGYGLAFLFGCQLDEGNVHQCVVAGADIGSMLYGMGLSFWLMFISLPLGLLLAVIGAVRRKA